MGESGAFDPLGAKFLLILIERCDATMRGLRAGAVNFQVAHHQERAAGRAQVNERVGHEQAGGVQHVRVAFAVRDHEQGFRTLHLINKPRMDTD